MFFDDNCSNVAEVPYVKNSRNERNPGLVFHVAV